MLTGEDKKFYNLSEKFSYVKTFFVTVKGFEKEDLAKLHKIKQELSNHDLITVNNRLNNKSYQEFKKKYRYYINDLNYKKSEDIDVKLKLEDIFKQMISSPFYVGLDKNDPLGILQKEKINQTIEIKNGNLVLGDYGYLVIFSIEADSTEKARAKIYGDIKDILSKYNDTEYFSTIFYYVENSQKIQSDVTLIIMISMVLLGLLYLFILKNIYLFVNIAATLATSVIIGQLVTTAIFPQTSIIALVFSTAITSVSIDYMFHHYLHNYYNKKLGFNKAVFYGFLTTITAFILISFINFPLIKQISIFTIASLSVAYIHFAFIYPYIGIKHKEPYRKENFKSPFEIKGYKFALFSLLVVIGSLYYVSFDLNIKNLDYKNKRLINDENFFRMKLAQKDKTAVIITANTIDAIIENSKIVSRIDPDGTIPMDSLLSREQYIQKQADLKGFGFGNIKKDLETISPDMGFKKGYFNQSYSKQSLEQPYPKYTIDMIKGFGYDLVYDGFKYITYAMVTNENKDKVLQLDFVSSAESKVLFENSLKKVYGELMMFGSLTLLFIISILAIVTKKRFLQAFTYILFPASLILLFSWFVPLNIMHLFMAFVILAIGIDYGIYMNEPSLSHNTSLAIIYSLLSTFAGFGVLIVSDINSLFSIGITAVIGVFGILFLLLFQRRPHKH